MSLLVDALRAPGPLVTVELRPPRSGLSAADGMSAWIDLHHTIGRLAREDLFVFLTDNAVGAAEEENLAHVGANVGDAVDLRRIVPILTCKHTLDYCKTFALRAVSSGFDALTVLGGWVNPHRDAVEQVGFVTAGDAFVDFALTQVVSHHSLRATERFAETLARSGADVPVVYGVFYYRSANPGTLDMLSRFFPVPLREIRAEFAAGACAEDVCARSIRALRDIGAEKVYVSNLGERGAGRTLARILERV